MNNTAVRARKNRMGGYYFLTLLEGNEGSARRHAGYYRRYRLRREKGC